MRKENIYIDTEYIKLNDLMKGMRYGTVTIIVQDGKIIQIDKTEKHRL